MSRDGRISELSAKHRKLDEQITAEQKRPSADELAIRELKRQKLRIKEQLQELQSG
jgi:hypothetical protein